MMRLPRFLPCVVIACCSVALPVFSGQIAFAQENGASQTGDAALKTDADSFWHYAKTYRYDLASAQAKKIADAKPDPLKLLQAFEAVSADRKDNLDQWMLRWQQVPELREPVDQLLAILSEGHKARRADQNVIEQNIQKLPISEQSYAIAIGQLRDSGELAVPEMLTYLRDPKQQQYHAWIRRALIDMGRPALAPLVAALDAPANGANEPMLLSTISALSEIGYDTAIPQLVYLANDAQVPPVIKTAAKDSLVKMGAGDPAKLDASLLFYDLAQKYYYGKSAVSPETKTGETSYWLWDDAKGLYRLEVPTPIFGDAMAMRAAKKSLTIKPDLDQSLSLWLAADYGSEVNLPEGAKDPTKPSDQPSAHYYGVASGAKYLNAVITRALGDGNSGVALAAVRSLQQIGGDSTLFAGNQSQALVSAMQYPDRLVRFEAAFAAAAALPQSRFEGQERVVPILAEAVAQTGKPYVVVVGNEAKYNARVQELKDAGYVATGVQSPEAAVSAAVPAVDVLLITDEDPAAVEKLREVAAQTPKLQGAALLIITATQASPFTVWAAQSPLVTTTQLTATPDLKPVLESARKKAGALPIDEKLATAYALKATNLLGNLAISRGQVLDLAPAEPTLLQALDDSRSQVVTSAANVLALLKSAPAQSALLIKAGEASDPAVKISLYNSLTTSAKFWGNLLSPDQIASLQSAVVNAPSMEIRNAAAEAHGALNLSADQVKALLLGAK